MKNRLTTIATVGALGLGGVASTVVLAPAVVSAATSDAESLADDLPRRHHHGGPDLLLDGAADTLGLTSRELRRQLTSGRTLAEIAEDQGIDKQDLVDDLLAKASERVERRVKEGRFSDAQGERLKTRLAERLTALVDGDFPGPYARSPHGGPGADWRVESDPRRDGPRRDSPRHDHPRHDSPRTVSPPDPGTPHTEI